MVLVADVFEDVSFPSALAGNEAVLDFLGIYGQQEVKLEAPTNIYKNEKKNCVQPGLELNHCACLELVLWHIVRPGEAFHPDHRHQSRHSPSLAATCDTEDSPQDSLFVRRPMKPEHLRTPQDIIAVPMGQLLPNCGVLCPPGRIEYACLGRLKRMPMSL